MEKRNVGPGIFGLIGVAFVILKLCGVIGWSWWWVTAPFWAPAAAAIAFIAALFAGMFVLAAVTAAWAWYFQGTAYAILDENGRLINHDPD